VAHLLQARTLTRADYDDIEGRIQVNDDVSDAERWCLARTQIEKFYRQPLSEDLLAADNRGRLRSRIARFEALENHVKTREARARIPIKDIPDKYGLRTRFLRDERMVSGLLYDLLVTTPIFDEGRFDTEKTISFYDLACFVRECQTLKPVIENALGFEVSTDRKMNVKQLNAVLGVIGQHASKAGKSKIGDDTVYRYRIDTVRLNLVRDIVERRKRQQGWPWIYEYYRWPRDSEDD
jgi:hypothetical protein